jgi:hypothetical protein
MTLTEVNMGFGVLKMLHTIFPLAKMRAVVFGSRRRMIAALNRFGLYLGKNIQSTQNLQDQLTMNKMKRGGI